MCQGIISRLQSIVRPKWCYSFISSLNHATEFSGRSAESTIVLLVNIDPKEYHFIRPDTVQRHETSTSTSGGLTYPSTLSSTRSWISSSSGEERGAQRGRTENPPVPGIWIVLVVRLVRISINLILIHLIDVSTLDSQREFSTTEFGGSGPVKLFLYWGSTPVQFFHA